MQLSLSKKLNILPSTNKDPECDLLSRSKHTWKEQKDFLINLKFYNIIKKSIQLYAADTLVHANDLDLC